MDNILFGFDLHNTLIDSNAAWERAYLELFPECVASEVRRMIFDKTSRKKISELFGLDHSIVINKYMNITKKKTKIFDILAFYVRTGIKPFLISSAKKEIVYADIKNDIANYIDKDRIFSGDDFDKSNIECWNNLLKKHSAAKFVYYGNDIEEDYVENDNVICVLSSQFLVDKKHILMV